MLARLLKISAKSRRERTQRRKRPRSKAPISTSRMMIQTILIQSFQFGSRTTMTKESARAMFTRMVLGRSTGSEYRDMVVGGFYMITAVTVTLAE
ncbi:hypothetical protein TOPH_06136 [Tolypocladium ophioglossoides CBS 100239]|uniref:Uncharacterized protein n=1 Tax=Tolypocladium ophioglossoides (strain CBS 100239) TaxID=1163406 RepID=A0A0L0N5D8_TOLOC|nr:hypothetical protein TOPH_06136 [Tolypocladium ophioglossoides CBS 100239]